MNRSSTKSLIYPAIGAGLIAVLSQITIPPFTLQTLAVGLIASLYPPKEAVNSLLLYLFLGAIGLPVFAGFSGGIAILWGPTAGFLWGFLFYAALTSRLTPPISSLTQIFLANLLGDILCLLLGGLVFSLITHSSLGKTAALTVLPFLIPDLVKVLLITIAYRPLNRFVS